ncbi:diphthamide biosynthesis 4 [Glossina fuscipes fuscipes]
MTTRTYYDILNASPNLTIDELKTNYKQLILQYHPDKLIQHQQQDDLVVLDNIANERSTKEFVDITEAWNCLKDPIKRKEYDAQLMLSKFHTHNNTYATITLNDMKRTYHHKTRNIDTNDLLLPDDYYCNYYAYDCRCGGQYIIDDDSAEQFFRKQNNDDAAPRTQNNNDDDADEGGGGSGGGYAAKNDDDNEEIGELIVECNECSLVIILNG